MQYAKVAWTAGDVQALREDWTEEEAESFLLRNQRRLQDRMVEVGWQAMEDLIEYEENEKQ